MKVIHRYSDFIEEPAAADRIHKALISENITQNLG